MDERLDDWDWEQAFEISGVERVIGSGVSNDNFTREDVERILVMDEGAKDDLNWIGVFKLKDGRYVFISAGREYTGWDRRSWGQAIASDSLDSLIRFGLGDDDRERLHINLVSRLDLIEDLM